MKRFFLDPLFRQPSLAKRLLFYVIPTALLGISVLGTSAFLIARRYVLDNVQKEIGTLGQEVSLNLSSFFRQRLNDLETTAESPLLADYYNNREFGLMQEAETYRQEIERYFLRFTRRTGGLYVRLVYVDRKGMEISAIESGEIVQHRKLSPHASILDALRGLPPSQHYSSPIFDDPKYGLSLLYSKPIASPGGDFKGAVILQCSLKPVQDILGRLTVGKSGWSYLTDQSGTARLGDPPPSSVKPSSLLSGETPVTGTPWKVVVGARKSDFLKPLARIQHLTFLMGVLCSFLVVLFIFMRVRALTRPIQDLVLAARRLEVGDLAQRVNVLETDEIGTLAQAFNRMADSLEQRTQDLQTHIRQLTALREMEGTEIQNRDEEGILRNCLKAVVRGFSFDRTALYWIDTDKHEIYGRMLYGTEASGFMEESFRKRRVPLDGQDILNDVVRSRAGMLVNNPQADPRLNREFVQESKTSEFVLSPICGKDCVYGVIAVDNYYTHRPLSESDKNGLTLFANAVGLALENMTLLQHLTESEARYRTILENSPVAVIGLSKEHWITTWNRGAEQMFGWSAQDIVGKPVTALFPPIASDSFKHLLAEVMHKGSIRDYSIAGLTRDGKGLDLSLSWGGAYQDFWMNKEWAVVIRDVSEAKKLQQQIIRSEKLSVVGQLISSIAHELNNPLQAVIGYAQLLAAGAGTELMGDSKDSRKDAKGAKPEETETQEDLRMIFENALRCRKIIDNLLLFVRHGEVEKKPVKIEDAVRASLELLEYKLKKAANIRVTVNLPPKLPLVKADIQQLQQVIVNLINNACDAMSGWGGSKALRITAEAQGGLVRMEIADSGPGIPADAKDRLFEPFFTTKSEGHGTGLGLTVCKQIIEDHGGRLGFDSEEGQGTTFWMELPMAQGAPKRARAQEAPLPLVQDKTVLLLDDEPDVLAFLERVVQAEGDQTETAATLDNALRLISTQPFDLVVADIRLEEGTGVDLYEQWNKWSNYPRPPFLFLTGDVLDSGLGGAIEKRGLPLLYKPVDVASFQRAFRSLLLKT